MQEIKIPEGHKATILGGVIRIEPIEKVQEPEFKRGDYVIGYIGNIKYACIYDVCCVYMSPLESENVMYAPFVFTHVIKTNKQSIQLLFDALVKEGKYWDAKELDVKDFIKVPKSIGIYKNKYISAHGLFIGFNGNCQMLGYHMYNKQWIVASEIHKYERVQCKLIPCKREDLKVGGTVFISHQKDFDAKDKYYKCLGDKFVRPNFESVSVVTIEGNPDYYKVVLIK